MLQEVFSWKFSILILFKIDCEKVAIDILKMAEVLRPLEDRKIPVRVGEKCQERPAIDKSWVTPRVFVEFVAPPTDTGVSGALEVWSERMNYILGDLDFLLRLEYHKFWSQMVHDPELQSALAQYLQTLPRNYDLQHQSGGIVASLVLSVTHKLFLVFLRLSTFKESKTSFMSAHAYGNLIYNNYLFDIPRIIDICSLFRTFNPAITDKMIANIFKSQPSYFNDLEESVNTMVSNLYTVTERSEVICALPTCDTPEQISALEDLIAFVTDICVSVSAFLESYPPSAAVFHSGGYEVRLAAVYQNVLVPLTKYVFRQKASRVLDDLSFQNLLSRLQLSRSACVVTLRTVISFTCIEPVVERREDKGEDYLQITSGCLSEGMLIVDYNNRFPVEEDLDIFTQSRIELDSVRVGYVLEGIRSLSAEIQTEKAKEAEKSKKAASLSQPQPPSCFGGARPKVRAAKKPDSAPAAEVSEASSAASNGVLEDSLISQVKDLLPDLGDGFVQACLDYFDRNPEKVINAIFEENLPPHLADLPRDFPKKEPEVKEVAKATEVASSPPPPAANAKRRYNVYDGDEFDINERDDINKTRVFKGKHSTVASGAKNANALLDDKKDIKAMKSKFEAMSIVTDDLYFNPGEYDPEYDDEYDDTYDENAVGQAEPDAKDELTERREFVLPRALGGGHVNNYVNIDDEDDEEEDEEAAEKKRREFVRNPAEVRAEKERKWAEQQSRNQSGRKGRYNGPKPVKDVVGGPKGQGQDKQVLINRARKNTNKGKQHRAGADRKAGKGMF